MTSICSRASCLALAALCSLQPSALSQATRIFMDGEFTDWQPLSPIYVDPAGDYGRDQVDFHGLWVTNDEHSLFLRIQLGQAELNLQDGNRLFVYLDTDDNRATGLSVQGLGAELSWQFGARSGTFYNAGQSFQISQDNIGIITSPTVTAREFEIRFDRSAVPVNGLLLFPSTRISLALASLEVDGDVLPQVGESAQYEFDDSPLPPVTIIPLHKADANSLRVMSYNVLNDGIFDSARRPSFERIFRAAKPDIIGLEEVYSGTTAQVVAFVSATLPLAQGQWHAAKSNADVVAISRFPIVQSFELNGNGAFLLDLRPELESDLLLIVAHPPCCTNDQGRQAEIDAMMAFIREAKSPGGILELGPNTPIVMVGDFNLVGEAQQLNTLLTGDIANNIQFGPDFSPDWDGSPFADLLPRHAASAMFYTWISPTSSFSPGRIDFMIFSDSVLEPLQSFVLYTPELPADTLSKYGLNSNDTNTASDHLPVVGDYVLRNTTRVANDYEPATEFLLLRNFPNPFNPTTAIAYHIPSRLHGELVELSVFDAMGQHIRSLLVQRQAAGNYSVEWNGMNDGGKAVASGLYFVRLRVGPLVKQMKVLLAR